MDILKRKTLDYLPKNIDNLIKSDIFIIDMLLKNYNSAIERTEKSIALYDGKCNSRAQKYKNYLNIISAEAETLRLL